jgi:(2R)-ethylmalonyl-CoA mutase
MTINATAPWLLALYVAVADEQGADRARLAGTTQNDIIKEYLSRGTYVFPPEPSLRLTTDMIGWTYKHTQMEPDECLLLPFAGGRRDAGSGALFCAGHGDCGARHRQSARDYPWRRIFPKAVGRISFFVNAGMRFVTEMCKMRAFVDLWDEICEQRYGVDDPEISPLPLWRSGQLAGADRAAGGKQCLPHLDPDAGRGAVEKGPRARRAASGLERGAGLPRPWDQQWSLRMQQVMAYETDLLEFGHVRWLQGSGRQGRGAEDEARAELAQIEAMGGAVAAIESSYMKQQLVEANTARLEGIEKGEQTVVGVNRYEESEPSPLGTGEGAIMVVPDGVEEDAVATLNAWRSQRDDAAVEAAIAGLKNAAEGNANIMDASVEAAKAGVTTGEWGRSAALGLWRIRAPTGVGKAARADVDDLAEVRADVDAVSAKMGRRLKMLVGKPGLDGHSNGAEQIAVRARDCGMEVVYEGIRLTPAEIVNAAIEEDVHMSGCPSSRAAMWR